MESESERTEGRPPKAGWDPLWLAVVWGRVVVGLGLAGVSGVAFGHAWSRDETSFWWVGGISLLTGILLVLSACYARSEAVALPKEVVAQAQHYGPEPLVPLLGALLVYKYQAITQEQLAKALAEQRRSRRLLGEILLSMGVVNPAQLAEALEYQHSVAETKRGAQSG